MAAIIDDLVIEQVKDQADIVEIIGRSVDLKKQGTSYMGLCPFHHEKTPSFSVQREKGYYHCFGCGAGGDVISFVMESQNMSFIEAVTYLAEDLHIPLRQGNQEAEKRKKKRDRIYQMNREAALYYMKILSRHSYGLAYLESRGINHKTLLKFGLGFAPSGGDQLRNHLLKKGYKEEELYEADLLSYNEEKNHYFDRFRNRLIFPIIDTRSRVIGFGGRVLGEGLPKYLNTKETPVFTKGTMLYGLNLLAKESDRSKILLVEGYMDVIALYKSGINYSTASLGTALTRDQARLIKRYGKEVYICYDGDQAGVRASKRAIQVLFQEDIHPKIVQLKDGLDPDDFIKKYGVFEFEAALKGAITAVAFYIQEAEKNFNLSSTESFSNFLREIAAILSRIQSPVEQDVYLDRVAQAYGVSKEALRLEMGRVPPRAQSLDLKKEREKKPRDPSNNRILTLLAYSLESQDFCSLVGRGLGEKLDLKDKWKEVLEGLGQLYQEGLKTRDQRIEALLSRHPEYRQEIEKILEIKLDLPQGEKIIQELIDSIYRQELEQERDMLLGRIRHLEGLASPSEEERKRLKDHLIELTEIVHKLGSVSRGGLNG
ncbi:MAG: DNA primase [Tissierellia bacterium]|nr:DNA primase [Tissierellia bacterium]